MNCIFKYVRKIEPFEKHEISLTTVILKILEYNGGNRFKTKQKISKLYSYIMNETKVLLRQWTAETFFRKANQGKQQR